MAIDFVDLHVHSTYSVLDGHPDPDEIIDKAVALGRSAIALTDHGSVSGHVLFEKAVAGVKQKSIGANTMFIRDGKVLDIKPIFGMEAYTVPDARGRSEEFRKKFHLSVIAKNQDGYRNLLKLVTRSFEEGFYYRQTIDGSMLLDQKDGLIILSGCETGNFMRHIESGDYESAKATARAFRVAFGDDFYIEVQHFPHMTDKVKVAWQIAEELGIKTVLTCDTHYLEPEGWKYQQFLWSIRDAKPIDGFRIEHAYLWEPEKLFQFVSAQAPEINWQRVFENTVEVGQKCEAYKLPRAPHVKFPMEGNKLAYIRAVVIRRLEELGLADKPDYIERLDRELRIIAAKEYEDYFLVVADMIRWAKSQGIFVGPARGSSAGSLICYGLRITEIDPIRYGLMFERFVDPTRVDLPDIDCDFEDERRDEVFAYMARRWGEENVAHISTFARLGGKSALDDAARSFKIPSADIDVIKRHLVERSSGDQRAELTIQDTLEEFPEAREVYERWPQLDIASGVQGKIRHLGKHAAGLIVTSEPVTEYVGIYKAGDQRLIAVDWRDSMYLNLMKIDVLGLKELSILRIIAALEGFTLDDLYQLPVDDPIALRGFNAHDYLGIFQYTGLATKGVASRIEFENVEQIADVNALSRPGPLHAGATESYIRGKQAGWFEPILPQKEVKSIIDPTFGQIIYQEQVMRILREVGNMSWQDVCDIRNIMGKSKGSEAFDNYWSKWEEGATGAGLSVADAKQIWETIRLYGKHGFNKSHSVAYGIVAYWSMYMKQHHPRSFYTAQLIKAADEDAERRFILEALRKGIEFAPFSLATRGATWHVDDAGRIAPGWQSIKGIGPKAGEELAKGAPFDSMDDLVARVNRRICNVRVQGAVSQNLHMTVEDLYGLGIWRIIDERFPERCQINKMNEGLVWSQKPQIVGRLTRINKKNRIEEWKTKGKDVSKLDPSAPQDYVILIVEDETDSCMVYVSPELYSVTKDTLWGIGTGGFVHASGRKMPDLQMLTAQSVNFMTISTEPIQEYKPA